MILDCDLCIQVPLEMSLRNQKGLKEVTELYYYLYRNIGIVVRNSKNQGNYVATIFIIPDDYMNRDEYIEHITTITKKIKRLQAEYNELLYKNKQCKQ